MKWAVLSDIHANIQALDACEQHARSQGVERWAVLGDLVGYGGDPLPVVERMMHWHAQGACVLQGNHDEMAVTPPQAEGSLGAMTAAWTYQQLPPHCRRFLAQLPLTHRDGHMLLVHASAHKPREWRYVDTERAAQQCLDAARHGDAGQATHVLVGHVHEQTLFYQGNGRQLMAFAPTAGVPVPVPRHRSWVASVGAVGQPRDGDTRAMYAVYDDASGRITFHRVAYDHSSAAAAIRKAGLPEFFASRLEEGR